MVKQYKYDIMKMYFGEDYSPCEGIVIHQPTLGDIIEYGENRFWTTISMLCANPTSMRLELWRAGIDWNELEDFSLFSILIKGMNKSETSIIFGDLDLTKFKPVCIDEKIVLVNTDDAMIQIDEDAYDRLVGYLRTMFNIHPKVEKAKNKATKEAIIFEEEQNLKIQLKKQEKERWTHSLLFPLISAAINHPGFKYKKSEVKEMGIVEFMDSVQRLQVYENVTSLMTGMYMGMVDTSKLDMSKELNWARNLYED